MKDIPMDIIDALDIVTEASVIEVLEAIKSEYGEDEISVIADNLAYLAVMLKSGGKENGTPV
jgi:hypothetical protein